MKKYFVNLVVLLVVAAGVSLVSCGDEKLSDTEKTTQIIEMVPDASVLATQSDKELCVYLDTLYPWWDTLEVKFKLTGGSGSEATSYRNDQNRVNRKIDLVEKHFDNEIPSRYLNWRIPKSKQQEDAIKDKKIIAFLVDSIQALIDSIPSEALDNSPRSDSLFAREEFLLNYRDSLVSLDKVNDSLIAHLGLGTAQEMYVNQAKAGMRKRGEEKTKVRLASLEESKEEEGAESKWYEKLWMVPVGLIVLIILLVAGLSIANFVNSKKATSTPTSSSSGTGRLAKLTAAIASIILSLKTPGGWSWFWSGVGKVFLFKFLDTLIPNLWLRRIVKAILAIVLFGLFVMFVVPDSWKNKLFGENLFANITWTPILWWTLGTIAVLGLVTLIIKKVGNPKVRNWSLAGLMLLLLIGLGVWQWDNLVSRFPKEQVALEEVSEKDSSVKNEKGDKSEVNTEEVVESKVETGEPADTSPVKETESTELKKMRAENERLKRENQRLKDRKKEEGKSSKSKFPTPREYDGDPNVRTVDLSKGVEEKTRGIDLSTDSYESDHVRRTYY